MIVFYYHHHSLHLYIVSWHSVQWKNVYITIATYFWKYVQYPSHLLLKVCAIPKGVPPNIQTRTCNTTCYYSIDQHGWASKQCGSCDHAPGNDWQGCWQNTRTAVQTIITSLVGTDSHVLETFIQCDFFTWGAWFGMICVFWYFRPAWVPTACRRSSARKEWQFTTISYILPAIHGRERIQGEAGGIAL